MEEPNNQNQIPTSHKTLQQEYQEALLKSGIQAAKLLNELIELKLMPDPRAKEMADLALEVIKIIHSAPEEIVNFKENNDQP
jgi:predicted house-cleaning noncanonical NTP pyrophosphatase (MazG superfamily)